MQSTCVNALFRCRCCHYYRLMRASSLRKTFASASCIFTISINERRISLEADYHAELNVNYMEIRFASENWESIVRSFVDISSLSRAGESITRPRHWKYLCCRSDSTLALRVCSLIRFVAPSSSDRAPCYRWSSRSGAPGVIEVYLASNWTIISAAVALSLWRNSQSLGDL